MILDSTTVTSVTTLMLRNCPTFSLGLGSKGLGNILIPYFLQHIKALTLSTCRLSFDKEGEGGVTKEGEGVRQREAGGVEVVRKYQRRVCKSIWGSKKRSNVNHHVLVQ